MSQLDPHERAVDSICANDPGSCERPGRLQACPSSQTGPAGVSPRRMAPSNFCLYFSTGERVPHIEATETGPAEVEIVDDQ